MRSGMQRLGLVVMLSALAIAGCGGPPPPPIGGPEAVEGGVLFRYKTPHANRVNLVGDSNGWSPTADPMPDENGEGKYPPFYPLGVGTYPYKSLVEGKNWVTDPGNP